MTEESLSRHSERSEESVAQEDGFFGWRLRMTGEERILRLAPQNDRRARATPLRVNTRWLFDRIEYNIVVECGWAEGGWVSKTAGKLWADGG